MDSSIVDSISVVLGGILFEDMLTYEDFAHTEKYGMETVLEVLRKSFEVAIGQFDAALFEERDPRFSSRGFEERELLTRVVIAGWDALPPSL
jgi:hypothetical protein